MAYPDGTVPGKAEIPLHVRIEGEHLSCVVEGQIEGVAEAGAYQAEVTTDGVDMGDPSAMRIDGIVVSVGIPDEGKEVIDLVDGPGLVIIHLRDLGKVTRYNI